MCPTKTSPFTTKNTVGKIAFGNKKRQNMVDVAKAGCVDPSCFQAEIRPPEMWWLTAKTKSREA